MSMKDVYISGSSGFIGKELLRQLRGHNIVGGDRLGSVHKHFDYLFNLATYGNYHDQPDIQQIYDANLMLPMALLRNASGIEYEAFVTVSTSSVTLPYQTFYSQAKLAMEGVCQVWARDSGKPICIARPYSVTGPGEQPRHLIPTLIRSCLKGEEVKLDPDPVHDFIDVRDFVSGLICIAEHARNHRGEIFSVGSGTQFTNKHILDLVEQATKKKANVVMTGPQRVYDTDVWVSDNTKIKKLGWEPKIKLVDTIKDMVQHER